MDGVLYFVTNRCVGRACVVVPHHLRQQLLHENHSGPSGGHFSGQRTLSRLTSRWWWKGMYADTVKFCRACPGCSTVSGTGRHNKPPLCPIPVQKPFQIVSVDIMELPKTNSGKRHVVVLQDFFTKWPLVFARSDQQSLTLVKLLVEELVPFFGVPEALLSDRGTNLLSHLMLDMCGLLGTTKLNTTAYHPQFDRMIDRFNWTLKAMIWNHAAQFGGQWDQHLSGVLWAYRNTPHDSTGEKPLFAPQFFTMISVAS